MQYQLTQGFFSSIMAQCEVLIEDKRRDLADCLMKYVPIFLSYPQSKINDAFLEEHYREIRKFIKADKKAIQFCHITLTTMLTEIPVTVRLLATEVLLYLNQKAHTTFPLDSKPATRLIWARSNDGYELPEFKFVIDRKVKQWSGTSMAKFLRPATLFNATHFETYLNEQEYNGADTKAEQQARKSALKNTANAVSAAQQIDWGVDKE